MDDGIHELIRRFDNFVPQLESSTTIDATQSRDTDAGRMDTTQRQN